jgi:hypothetical protein
LTQGRTRTQEGGGEGLKSPYEDFPLPAFRVFFRENRIFFGSAKCNEKWHFFGGGQPFCSQLQLFLQKE